MFQSDTHLPHVLAPVHYSDPDLLEREVQKLMMPALVQVDHGLLHVAIGRILQVCRRALRFYFLPSLVLTPVLPPTAESTCDNNVVGI